MTTNDTLALIMSVLMLTIALFFIIRAKLAKPTDYSDAIDEAGKEQTWYTIQQEKLIARQDADFREGR